MASTVLVDSSELTCSICLDVFKDPRVLPCVHSYCNGCLEGWVKKSGSSRTITCPLCKEASPIPSGGLNKIKNNYFVADLVGRINEKDVKSSKQRVEFAKLSQVRQIYCKSHSTNPIDQYCVDCDIAACGTCLLRNHRHHKLVDMDKQAKISKQQLQDVLKQTDELIKLIDEQMKDTEKHMKESTDDISSIKHQINKVIDDKISKLKQQRQQLVNSLDKIQAQKEKVMMTVHDGQEFTKAAVSSLRAYTDKKLRHGRNFDRVQQAGDIRSRLNTISSTRMPSCVWRRDEMTASSNDDTTVARVSMVTEVIDTEANNGRVRVPGARSVSVRGTGSVSLRESWYVSQTGSGSVSVRGSGTVSLRESGDVSMRGSGSVSQRGSGEVSVRESEAVSDNVVSKISMIKQDAVRGLLVMGQTVWVAQYMESSIQAYRVTSPHQPQTLPIDGHSEPYNMVRFPPGQSQLVISYPENNQLLWIKLDQRNGVWKVSSQILKKVGYSPRGLGVHDNQLLVCDTKVIHVLSTSCEETHRVNMPQGLKPYKAVGQLTSPGFIIMDCDKEQVVLLTEKGEIQRIYQCQKGFYPGDIVCHGHSVYVTEPYNHRVDELSVDGRHVRQLIRGQGMGWPFRMCIDDTGRLYVAQGGDKEREVWVIETTVTPTDTQATPGDRILTQQTNMNFSITWCKSPSKN